MGVTGGGTARVDKRLGLEGDADREQVFHLNNAYGNKLIANATVARNRKIVKRDAT